MPSLFREGRMVRNGESLDMRTQLLLKVSGRVHLTTTQRLQTYQLPRKLMSRESRLGMCFDAKPDSQLEAKIPSDQVSEDSRKQ